MNRFLEMARADLLEPAGLTDNGLQQILRALSGRGIDHADLYCQSSCSESWVLEEGIVKGGGFHVDRGVGIRAMSGDKTGFAYSDDIYLPALQQAADAARAISRVGGDKAHIVVRDRKA